MKYAPWFSPLLLAASCFAAAAAPDAPPAPPARPNILFVYTDDQGAWTTGYSGNPEAHTPVLDRLRSEGANLVNSFVTTPACSPARTTLITGRYASEFGIYDWINHRLADEQELGLDPGATTWPRLLQQAGYTTGLVGKWHLGTAARYHPTRFGYDYFMGLLRGGCPPRGASIEEDGEERKFDELTIDVLTDRAIGFLERHAAGPFALSVHYRAPHAAWLPVADEDWAPYADLDPTLPEPDYPDLDTPRAKKCMREYLAAVTSVDRSVGRLLDTLERLELAYRTIVVFTSDHGYNVGHHGLLHKGNATWLLTDNPPKEWELIDRGRRPNMFDTSLRVPTLVRWPGVVAPGATVTHSVTNLDWFPTLLAMAGVPVPPDTIVRGRDIGPLLRGGQVEWDDDYRGEYSMHHGSRTAMRMVRTPQWKLMVDFAHGDGGPADRGELYDLAADPNEEVNLFRAESVRIQSLRAQLDQRLRAGARATGDPLFANEAGTGEDD